MKYFTTAISSLCFFAMVMLASCSSDPMGDEPATDDVAENGFRPVRNGIAVQGDVNFDVLNRYQGAVEDVEYKIDNRALYMKDELSAGLWERMNERFIGGGYSVPTSIIIRDGKFLSPVSLFTCDGGPTAFSTALLCVNKAYSKKYKVYVRMPFSIDSENNSVSLGKKTLNIVNGDAKSLVLTTEMDYYGGRTHNGGSILEIGFYTKNEPFEFDESNNLCFDSAVEAYDWLIELFESSFGEQVHLSYVYNAKLDNPYFNVSELKEERDSLLQE